MVKAWRTGIRPDYSQCFPLYTPFQRTLRARQDCLSQELANNVASKREARVVSQDSEIESSTQSTKTNYDNTIILQDGSQSHVGASASNNCTADTNTQLVLPTKDSNIWTRESILHNRMSLSFLESDINYLREDDLSELPDTFNVRKGIHSYHHERRRSWTEGPFTSGHISFPSADANGVMEKMRPFLGKVYVKGAFAGTCLAVGTPEHPCAITCYHVIDKGLSNSVLEEIRVEFMNTHRLVSETLKYSEEEDYAIMELRTDEGLTLPATWRKFGQLATDDQPIYMIGFQKGILQIDGSAVILNRCSYNLVDIAQKAKGGYSSLLTNKCDSIRAGKTLVQSSIYHGGSGGVGVTIENGELRVVLMFQRGFPDQYYTEMDLRQKINFESQYLIEQGMTFSEIYDSLSRETEYMYMSADSLFDIFSSGNVSPIEEFIYENIRYIHV